MLHATMMLVTTSFTTQLNALAIATAHAARVLFLIHLSLQTAALILKNMTPCDLATGCHSRLATIGRLQITGKFKVR